MYNSILIKNNKIKYLAIIVIEIFSNIVSMIAIKSFYLENSDESVYLLYGVLLIINVLKYVFIRCVYKNELLNINNDAINIFLFSKRSKIKVLRYKLLQILIMLSYEIPITMIFSILFILTKEGNIVAGVNWLLGIIFFYFLAFIDMTVINKYKKGYFDGILNTIVLIGIINLFFNPSYLSFGILVILLLTLTISNFILILRSCQND